jgi:hypothetical protein
MTEPAAPHGTTSTLPPPSANGSAPPRPGRGQPRTPAIGMRPGLIAGFAVLVVAVISSSRTRRLTTSSRPGGTEWNRQDHETRQRVPGPHSRRPQAHTRNRGTASPPPIAPAGASGPGR